jgi:DNA topoisomerase-1
MHKNLVIVESPAKAKTIEKFLSEDYEVKASMGHVIDLPSSRMGIEIRDDSVGTPEYVVIKGKQKVLTGLKKIAKNKSVFIATDPDREGEAIGWHISNYIKAKNPKRILLYEITKDAVRHAISHPESINTNRVNAQQARRILDRVVGYSISPVLWKKVGRGLSAGRVQSVAVRLIVERDRQIKSFVPQEYWSIEAVFSTFQNQTFISYLEKINDEKAKIKTKQEAEDVVNEIRKCKEFIVLGIKKTERKRHPPPPFTTSQLQQASFNRYRFPAVKTMKIAQTLYEGVGLGEQGSVGLITYMRTDSVNVSESAIKEVREFIKQKYGDQFCPDTPHRYKSKKTAQEAHEAVRPTSVLRTPESIRQYLTEEQFKIYELIYTRFVASQMRAAIFLQTRIEITNLFHPSSQEMDKDSNRKYLFVSTGSTVVFMGFLSLYQEPEDKSSDSSIYHKEESKNLPLLKINEKLDLDELKPQQHFTQPPPHYTEATLVKELEEKGIGRPSTYAPIIQTIIYRGYVRREKGALLATEIGNAVTDLLIKSFPDVMDIGFTAQMEDKLDEVERGDVQWDRIVLNFYKPFKSTLDNAQEQMLDLKKANIQIEEKCEKCGSPMVIKWGRMGRFIACSAYPSCKNTRSIGTGVKCPSKGCQGEIVQRRAKKGGRIFYGCSKFPECRFIVSDLKKIKEVEQHA